MTTVSSTFSSPSPSADLVPEPSLVAHRITVGEGRTAPNRPLDSLSGSSTQHRRVRLEGNACGPVACAIGAAGLVNPVDKAQPGTGRGLRGLAARAWSGNRLFIIVLTPAVLLRARRRTRLPVAGVVQRLVRVRGEHGPLPARPDPGIRVLHLAEVPAAASLLRCCNDSATSYGPGGRRDDLRAGQAPLRRPRLAGHAGRRAGALRRVRDPARAPDHGRRAVPVPGHAGDHAAAVGPGAVDAALRAGRRSARHRGGRAVGRAAAARGVRRLHDHQAGQLAEGRGRHRGVPPASRRLRRGVRLRARPVRDVRRHRRVPLRADDDVRRLRQNACPRR